ncbi:hypothetical protein SLA2020_360350 [Shorea laevis]
MIQITWGKDVEKFNPERFSKAFRKHQRMKLPSIHLVGALEYVSGQNFAMIEAKMALAMILQTFFISNLPSYAHAPCTVITLQPQHGAPIIVHRI